MAAKSRTAISPEHLGNTDILLPIEEVVDRALTGYEPGANMKKSDPSHARDKHRERALGWFQGKNIHFLGQLLLGAFSESAYGILPKTPLRRVLKDLGFELNEYIANMATNPSLKASLMDPALTFNARDDGSLYPNSVYKPFVGKSRDDIGKALKHMFDIQGPIPAPGLLPVQEETPAEDERILNTGEVRITLSNAWRHKAEKVYQPKILEGILKAISEDPVIQREIGTAKDAAIRGEEIHTDNIAPVGPDIIALDTAQIKSGLNRYFGDAADPVAELVDKNLKAKGPVIQSRAVDIITTEISRHFSFGR